jgi:hypothetical protein
VSALISNDGVYRYWLRRRLPPKLTSDGLRTCVFIMLNPSTADAERDDPTIRRCKTWAARVDATDLLVLNLYAYRAADPRDLWTAAFTTDIVGPDNDHHILTALNEPDHGIVIAAWGTHAPVSRVQEVLRLVDGCPLWCLGVNAGGSPKHPLYVPSAANIKPWSP